MVGRLSLRIILSMAKECKDTGEDTPIRHTDGVDEVGEADLTAAVADRLHSAAIHLLRRVRQQDVVGGLTGPRLSALSVVVFAGPLTIGALATAEQVRPPTMTRLVAALEEAGLVVRQPSEVDRRAVLVCATPAGHRLLQEGRTRRVAALAARLAALPPADLAALRQAAEVLERLSGGSG